VGSVRSINIPLNSVISHSVIKVFQRHHPTHRREQRFSYNVCNKSLIIETDLKSHQCIHSVKLPYFSKMNDLKKHQHVPVMWSTQLFQFVSLVSAQLLQQGENSYRILFLAV
jgi:hypothetical protein